MTINLNTLRGQAQQISVGQIKGDHALRMREDGQGIATTKWERFKVGFFDLFRSANTIANMKLAVTSSFIQSLQEKNYNTANIESDKPLSARSFVSTMASLARPEVQDAMRAAKNQAATDLRFNTTVKMLTDPTVTHGANNFSSNLNTVFKELHAQAKEAGVSEDVFNNFKNKWLSDGKADTRASRTLGESLAISLSKTFNEDKTHFSSVEANNFCTSTMKSTLTEKFNAILNDDIFRKSHPIDAAVKDAIGKRDPAVIEKVGSQVKVIAWASVAEGNAQRTDQKIIGPNERMAIRENALNKFFGAMESKAKLVDQFVKPEFPGREDLMSLVLEINAKMDEKFFSGALETMKNIFNKVEQIDIRNPDQATQLLCDVGLDLEKTYTSLGISGSDEKATFTELGRLLIAAEGGKATIESIRDQIMEQCDNNPQEFADSLEAKKAAYYEDSRQNAVYAGARRVFDTLTRPLP